MEEGKRREILGIRSSVRQHCARSSPPRRRRSAVTVREMSGEFASGHPVFNDEFQTKGAVMLKVYADKASTVCNPVNVYNYF